MPYPHEHACRLREPNGQATRRANRERTHDGKAYDVIYQQTGPKASDPWEEQAYRYPAETWTAAEARKHCQAHHGIRFEPATEGKPKATIETGCCGGDDDEALLASLTEQ